MLLHTRALLGWQLLRRLRLMRRRRVWLLHGRRLRRRLRRCRRLRLLLLLLLLRLHRVMRLHLAGVHHRHRCLRLVWPLVTRQVRLHVRL
jgi:hypothetical protein